MFRNTTKQVYDYIPMQESLNPISLLKNTIYKYNFKFTTLENDTWTIDRIDPYFSSDLKKVPQPLSTINGVCLPCKILTMTFQIN